MKLPNSVGLTVLTTALNSTPHLCVVYRKTLFGCTLAVGFLLSTYLMFNYDISNQIRIFYKTGVSRIFDKETPAIPPLDIGMHSSDGIKIHGNYCVMANYVLADNTYRGNESVTLTTQGSPAFLKHVEPLCQRWAGPVSVSVYVGGDIQLKQAHQIISHLRMCGHSCIRENVSWHLILELDVHWPNSTLGGLSTLHPLTVVGNLTEQPRWRDSENYECSVVKTFQLFQDAIDEEKERKLGRGYPINVARNVARSLATTYYILASDIELYPSINIIPRFLRLVKSEDTQKNGPHVYALPIFEVEKSEEPPKDKPTILKLLKENRAVYFHKYVCDPCQAFPKRNTWESNIPKNDSLGIHSKGRRARSIWEPIYIGTNAEPYYDEHLTWEGYKDKMSQMYELCILDYTVFVLDNAFLVHAPGVKRRNTKTGKYRDAFTKENAALYQAAIKELKKKYPKKHVRC